MQRWHSTGRPDEVCPHTVYNGAAHTGEQGRLHRTRQKWGRPHRLAIITDGAAHTG